MRHACLSLAFLLTGIAMLASALTTGGTSSSHNGDHLLVAPVVSADGQFAPPLTQPAGLTHCTVTNVVDGDTIDVDGCPDAGRLRLILVDTPEIFGGAECYGREASNYTKAALPPGTTVFLQRDVSDVDSFGRFLRYVWLDGELFNEQLVREGIAVLALFPPDTLHWPRIADAEDEARAAKRGLWETCGGDDVPATPTPGGSGPAPTPTLVPTVPAACDPSYPDFCIPPVPPNLRCSDIPQKNFTVLPPDSHGFDRGNDGLGCEG